MAIRYKSKEYSYSRAGVIPINTVLFDFDLLDLPTGVDLALHLTSMGTSGVITIQGSNTDNANFVSLWQEPLNTGTAIAGTTITALGVYLIPTPTRFIRITLTTATTAGTTAFTIAPISTKQRRTVTIGGSTTIPAGGVGAHDAVINGSPVRIGGRAVSANPATVSTGDTHDLLTTLNGALIVRQYSIPEADWQYTTAAGGIVNTTDNTITAAGAAGIRNYVTHLDLINRAAVETEFVIKDGATVIWRTSLPPSMTVAAEFNFPTPLKGTAATAMNVACLTTGAAVRCNAQGYKAA